MNIYICQRILPKTDAFYCIKSITFRKLIVKKIGRERENGASADCKTKFIQVTNHPQSSNFMPRIKFPELNIICCLYVIQKMSM